jgi:hypothetical protein
VSVILPRQNLGVLVTYFNEEGLTRASLDLLLKQRGNA